MSNQQTDSGNKHQSTEKTERTSPQQSWIWLLVAFALAALAYVTYFGIHKLAPNPVECAKQTSTRWTQETGGQLGDFVGGITNPLVALLTFSALIYTINLQRRQLDLATEQLDLMRNELGLTREELKLSREAMQSSREELKRSADAQERAEGTHQEAVELQRKSAELKAEEMRLQRLNQRRASLVDQIGVAMREIESSSGKTFMPAQFDRLHALEGQVYGWKSELQAIDAELKDDMPRAPND